MSSITLLMCGPYFYLPSINGSTSANIAASSICSAFSSTNRVSSLAANSGLKVPYPTENGTIAYSTVLTSADPVSSHQSAVPNVKVKTTHWYAGSESETDADACVIVTEIDTPSKPPPSGDVYFVGASVYDNTGSYDQIGLDAYHGAWMLGYSFTSGKCGENYSSSIGGAGAGKLNLSTPYIFGIEAANATLKTSYLLFYAINGLENHILWNTTVYKSDLEYLVISKLSCKAEKENYQNYEEVYNVTEKSGAPNFNFAFTDNFFCENIQCSPAYYPSWTPLIWPYNSSYTVPSVVKVKITGSSVCSKCVVNIHN